MPDLQTDMVTFARELRNLGYHSGTGLYDYERVALKALVGSGYVVCNPYSARRYELTGMGHVWLAGQGS